MGILKVGISVAKSVLEDQCMIIVDQGAIVEICAEASEFVYNTSTEPSIFYDSLGESIV